MEYMAVMAGTKMGKILAAAYCRESESDAITALCNQSDIVKKFIYSRQDLKFYAEYNDLGYTGRNFDRPGWQRLITDLNAGKFECIVVREMSRLGRNYIETAAVVEMLAEKKIRLIGIWDNVDTAKAAPGEAFQVQLENVVNDMYVRDTSRKVHSAFDNLRKQGLLLPTVIPYGYKRSGTQMIVDEETAPVVQRIFHEYSIGSGFTEIARGLTIDHIPSPRGAEKWTPQTIRAILANRMYTGEYVSGRQRQELHKRRNMPEDTWVRIQDHHKAVIYQADFDAVQERLLNPRRYMRRETEPDTYGGLIGIAHCGQCNRLLLNKNGKYYCKNCNVEVNERYIHQSLLDIAMKYQAKLPDVQKMNRTRLRLLAKPNAMVETAKMDYKRAWDDYEKWYSRFCDGLITLEEFNSRKPDYADRCKETEEIRDKTIENRENLDKQLRECRDFVRETKKLSGTMGEEKLKLIRMLTAKAELIRDSKGLKICVEMNMAAEIARLFDWWDGFEPVMIMIE